MLRHLGASEAAGAMGSKMNGFNERDEDP